uniref:Uncharacterized protein n=1 Tax=Cacopsylla melanoneura TaxID=428564 RepID=A0A8D8YPZ3_9HEMI
MPLPGNEPGTPCMLSQCDGGWSFPNMFSIVSLYLLLGGFVSMEMFPRCLKHVIQLNLYQLVIFLNVQSNFHFSITYCKCASITNKTKAYYTLPISTFPEVALFSIKTAFSSWTLQCLASTPYTSSVMTLF